MTRFKINTKKLKISAVKFPNLLGEKAFFTFFCLFILSLILAGFIFFKDVFLVRKVKIEAIEKSTQFKEADYQSTLTVLSEKKEKFQGTNSRKYLNPFMGGTSVIQIESKEEPTKEEALKLLEKENKTGKEAITLYEFYLANKKNLPEIEQRAKLWEELGLGKAADYYGSFYQNIVLLQELTK
jgi:CHASE3 domain sensor protein